MVMNSNFEAGAESAFRGMAAVGYMVVFGLFWLIAFTPSEDSRLRKNSPPRFVYPAARLCGLDLCGARRSIVRKYL